MPHVQQATLETDVTGHIFSSQYNDIYHSIAGALEQANTIFIEGTDVINRWKQQPHMTILETGFGLGINFLATWLAWKNDSQRCQRLHFVSIEKHPFQKNDLAQAYNTLSCIPNELRQALLSKWPTLLTGTHRITLDDGNVILTLVLGDIKNVIDQLNFGVDTFYLDGFSPSKNPEMWDHSILKRLARIARPHAKLATWSVSGQLRQALSDLGFQVQKKTGLPPKRHRLEAEFAPHWPSRAPKPPPALDGKASREIAIIGAGIAGVALAERFTQRGWHVHLLEQRDKPGQAASGNPAALIHPSLSLDDNVISKLSRHSFLYTLQQLANLTQPPDAIFMNCGVFQPITDDRQRQRWMNALQQHPYPSHYAEWINSQSASAQCGLRLHHDGLWYPQGGRLQPQRWIAHLLTQCGPQLSQTYQCHIKQIEQTPQGQWRLFSEHMHCILEVPVVVLANAIDAERLVPSVTRQIKNIRGQITHIPHLDHASLHCCIAGKAYALPDPNGYWVGASYDNHSDPEIRMDSHQDNLTRIQTLLSDPLPSKLDLSTLPGRVAFRAASPDRLPWVGAIPDESTLDFQAGKLRIHNLQQLPRLPGLYMTTAYGSRGMLWASLAAETIACLVEGEPPPINQQLLNAIDPGRFTLSALRHGDI